MRKLFILSLLLCLSCLPLLGQGYSANNFSQASVGAPNQTTLFNSWYGLSESGSDSAFGCTITLATCKIRINNSSGAMSIVAQASSVCGTVPNNSGGPNAKILDYATSLGSGQSNQNILFNYPSSQSSVTQGVIWFCSDIPASTSFGTTFDAVILIGTGSQISNFNCDGSHCGFGLEGSGQGNISYTPGTWVQLAWQYVNGGTCADHTTFTDCVRLSEFDASGNQITTCTGGGCKFDQYEGTAGAGPSFYVTLGNLNSMTLPSGRHVQFMNPKFCYQNCTLAQYPMKEYPVPAWDGIISSKRATDWTKAGTTAGNSGALPSDGWTQCATAACTTVTSAGTSATAAQITAALASASASTYVLLTAGTYNFSTGSIVFPTSGNVELRCPSAGCDFVFSGSAGASCGRSGTAFICAIDAANANITGTPTLSWTGGYTQGATSTTLSSTAGINTTASSAPTLLAYNQCDTGQTTGANCSSGTNTDNGQMFVGDTLYSAPNGCCGNGPGNIIPQRGEMEIHVATSASAGTAVLSTPLIMPNWASGQTPMVLPIQSIANFGVRNVRIKSPTVLAAVGISFQNAYNWWIQGSAVIDTNSKIIWGINCLGCAYGEVQSNYVYGISGNSNPYGIRCMMCSFNLFDNNIVQQVGTPFSFDGSSSGNVVSFNYIPNATFSPSSNLLQAAFNSHAYNTMDLYEGNVATQQDQDGIHGTADFVTNFRNGYMGWWSQPSNPINTLTNARNDASLGDRYMADVAGLYGSSIYHTSYLVSATCTGANSAVFLLGTACSYGIPGDALSKSTGLRFGNFDTVTNTVRFCGNSLDTGFSSTCGSASEVPTAASTYPTQVPVKGDTAIGEAPLPSSFYLSAAPSWWNGPFPAMGPDVSGGNLLQCGGTINTVGQFAGVPTTTGTHCASQGAASIWGGHANATPSLNCAQNVLGMPVDGSGSALAFNANSCYAGGGGGSPIVSLSSTTLAFGRQLVSTTSTSQIVTITNSGGATLNISSIALTTGTQYAITANTCGSTLAATFSCSVTMAFTPTTLGTKSDSLVITTNASTSPDHVSISGGGVPPALVYAFNVPLSTELCTNSNTGTNITTPFFAINFNYNSLRYWVQPNPANGHFYKVTTTGTSGGSQPSFNTGSGSTTTSGGVTFTEQGTTNAGECRDEMFLYVLPNIDGAVLGFNVVDLDPSNAGGTGQAAGGYTFSAMDTTINSFVTAAEWGVQDSVVLLFRPGTYHSPNTWTPTYWMNATYAASLGASANHACYCSGYPGDKAVGTSACFQDGDTTGVPVPFDVPFKTALNNFLAAGVAHAKAASYHGSVGYWRNGLSIGGEMFPFCASAMKTSFSFTTDQLKTAWTGAVQSMSNQLSTSAPNFPVEGAMSGLAVPNTGNVVGYDWADAEAIIYTNNGQGIADQGLTQADITAFATNGYASGGSASVAGTYCSNDFCYNFHALPGASPASLQMGTVSDPTGAGTGSLVDILPFATRQKPTALEIYIQDLLIAFDPNYPQYSTYHTAYALAISNFRNSIAGPSSVPSGAYGSAVVSGSAVIQ